MPLKSYSNQFNTLLLVNMSIIMRHSVLALMVDEENTLFFLLHKGQAFKSTKESPSSAQPELQNHGQIHNHGLGC